MKKLVMPAVLVLFFIFSQVANAVTPVDDDSNGSGEEDLYEVVNTMMALDPPEAFTSSTQLGTYEIECDDWWHEWNGFIAITVTYAGQDQELWWDDGTDDAFILTRSVDDYDYNVEYLTVTTATKDFYFKDLTGTYTWYSRDDLNADGETHFITYDMGHLEADTFIVAVEDVSGLGDHDYNDFVFKITKAGPKCLCIDNDSDGYGDPGHPVCPDGSQTDCDDGDGTVNPGATEVPYNGKDDDCNLATRDDDLDLDGYPKLTDCNDNDAAVHPGAAEICNDTKDNDCDALTDCSDPDCDGVPACCTDNDGDTYAVEGGACGPVDCDDNDNSVYPGATEACNDGKDNDCDALTDCSDPDCTGVPPCCTDNDLDTYAVEGGACGAVDCDDNDNSVYPGATEACNDGKDNDCDALTDCSDPDCTGVPPCCTDNDLDTYAVEGGACGAIDCDDNDNSVYPGATEACNDGKDNDCDALTDCSDPDCTGVPPCCTDNDLDTYAVEGGACGAIDCDDSDPLVNPGVPSEAGNCADGKDNDCDGLTNCSDPDCTGDPACITCTDNDLDTYAVEGGACGAVDCDDGDSSVNPGVSSEAGNCADGKDNDCDALTDCSDPDCTGDPACCTDNDLDTYAVEGGACGAVDCDDNDNSVYPGATEACNDGKDNDCDALTDCSDPDCTGVPPCCTDNDLDTYAVEGGACGAIDCDDSDPLVNPGVPSEAGNCADGKDNDCDGLTNCSDPDCTGDPACITCTDNDLDTYAVEGGACGAIDCDDNDNSVYPGATEACNDGKDNDCDALTDCSDPDCTGDPACCTDNDLDTYAVEGGACGPVDCNDTDDAVNPGATEVQYNGKDDDCNGATPDDDIDDDGFPIATDCDDGDPLVNPGVPSEAGNCADGKDNDCDGDINCDDSDCSGDPVCLTCTDNDGDGYYLEGGICGPVDCDDGDLLVNPDASEDCADGRDNDCDGDKDCADTDCAGDAACIPTGVALVKTKKIEIPGSRCFRVQIDNPGPYDVQLSNDISWLQTVPSEVQTTVLNEGVTVPAGQSKIIFSPCFSVGSGAEPGEYSLDIIWTGTDSMANPVQFSTDPAILLYFPASAASSSGSGVGGIGLPVDKLELVAPVLGRFLLMAGLILSIIAWRKKRRT